MRDLRRRRQEQLVPSRPKRRAVERASAAPEPVAPTPSRFDPLRAAWQADVAAREASELYHNAESRERAWEQD